MKKYLGIEFGSTRIKAVICDEKGQTLVTSAKSWENSLIDGIWTYDMQEVYSGLRECYTSLREKYEKKFGEDLRSFDGMGVSGMMHGYLAFDKDGKQLVPFRTWRNTICERASEELTTALGVSMPQRWSSVFFYSAVENGERHVKDVYRLYTLSSYIHFLLTGKYVVGIGEGSGMFPINGKDYDREKVAIYDKMLSRYGDFPSIKDIMPQPLLAGEDAGALTEDGAKLLDESGKLKAGIKMCPPEGDMQTGMVATNALKVRTGSVSAGTSGCVVVITDKPLKKPIPIFGLISSPDGNNAVIANVNNFTCSINAFAQLFKEVVSLYKSDVDMGDLMEKLFMRSLEADDEVGKITAYNLLSGEPALGTTKGLPLMARDSTGDFNLANVMQALIFTPLATMRIAFEKLRQDGGVEVDSLVGQGGFFKTEGVGQVALASALKVPITVLKNAGEGGAWGIAVLASFLDRTDSLTHYLDEIFEKEEREVSDPDERTCKKFEKYLARYKKGLETEKLAIMQF